MALKTYSAFYYGHTVTKSNKFLNFRDSAIVSPLQYVGLLDIGSYTITQFGNVVASAMNAEGSQEYTVTLDRVTRLFTISAPANFELLITSGINVTLSIFQLLGFEGADLSGSNTYTATIPSGESYITQYFLHNFSDFHRNKEKAEAQVKTTPAGITEVIAYSVLERMKCDLSIITNYLPQKSIRGTATGIEEAEQFLDYAIEKAPLEFLYDYKDPDNYVSCLLDKTTSSSKGVGYVLKERAKEKLPGYFEIKGLTFRKIEVR